MCLYCNYCLLREEIYVILDKLVDDTDQSQDSLNAPEQHLLLN
jgi:hypothetical protein